MQKGRKKRECEKQFCTWRFKQGPLRRNRKEEKFVTFAHPLVLRFVFQA